MALTRLPKDYNRGTMQGRMRDSNIYVGVVKNVVDAQRMGRLAVHIPELNSQPDVEASWIVVGYASPFAGATPAANINATSQTAEGSQKSYGFWAIPPDVGNEVLVCFANGDIGRGFWFGCLYQQFMDHMVPGIASNIPTDPALKSGDGTLPPVVEYNKSNTTVVENPPRPVYTPLWDGLENEGLTADFERGVSSTSARREAPSKVFGMLTPDGNSFSMDDNPENELIRLRTKSGVQVLIHETTGYVYINSKNGKSWLEVSDSGINAYSMNPISLRTEGDLNFRADGNMVFDSGGTIAMRAASGLTLGAGKSINIGAGLNLVVSSGATLALSATGDLTTKSGGSMHSQSGADTTVMSAGNSTRDAAQISDNAGASPSVADNQAQIPAGGSAPDVSRSGRPTTMNTICSVMPTHEPWIGHPRRDVPDQQKSGGNLPAYPSSSVSSGVKSANVPTGEGMRPTVENSPTKCGVGTKKAMSDAAHAAFLEAAGKTGLPVDLLMAVGDRESSFTPTATAGNASNSPRGLMQIAPKTFNGVIAQNPGDGISSSDIYDTRSSVIVGARYLQQSKATLIRNGVSNPTYGQIYSGYFLGPGDEATFAKALANNPDALARDVLPTAASYNPNVFGNLTVKQLSDSLNNDISTRASAYSNEANLPSPCARAGATGGDGKPQPNHGVPGTGNGTQASNPAALAGTVVANGQCVRYVQTVAAVGNTSGWTQGASVLNNPDIMPGTAIASFDANGLYGNHEDGSSHAAIYVGPAPDGNGIIVEDQWQGQPVHQRQIRNDGGKAANNAGSFSIINTAINTANSTNSTTSNAPITPTNF